MLSDVRSGVRGNGGKKEGTVVKGEGFLPITRKKGFQIVLWRKDHP